MDVHNKNSTSTLKCTQCDKIYSTKYNFDRHNTNKHGVNKEKKNIGKKCNICEKMFSRSTVLRRHINGVHKTNIIRSDCNKTSPDLKSLYQHNQTEHNYQIVDPLRQSCNLCDSKFSNKSNLTKHMRRVHQIEYEYKSLASLKCPLCELIFNVTSKLHEHIQKEHDISLEKVTLVFESVDEFQKWKINIEKEDVAFFTILRVNGNISYYGCHRSGSPRKTDTGKRLKLSDSNKINSRCPAQMRVTNIEGHITVDYCKTHVGHSKSVKFLHLNKKERDELAVKIKTGMTFDQILDDTYKSLLSSKIVHRMHVVDKRDLYNIVRDYDLDRNVVNKNDAFSTIDACVRTSKKKNEETTLVLENHNNSDIGLQSQSAHIRDTVSASSQLTSLINAALGIANSATDERKLEACKKIEEAIQILQLNQNVSESSNISGPHF